MTLQVFHPSPATKPAMVEDQQQQQPQVAEEEVTRTPPFACHSPPRHHRFNTPPAFSETTNHANPLSTPRRVEPLPDFDPEACSMSPSTSQSPELTVEAKSRTTSRLLEESQQKGPFSSEVCSDEAIWSHQLPGLSLPWERDEDHDSCHACKEIFTTMRRKHHCRQCGHIFCSTCSNQKMKKIKGYSKSVRACDDCCERDKWKDARLREVAAEEDRHGMFGDAIGEASSCHACVVS